MTNEQGAAKLILPRRPGRGRWRGILSRVVAVDFDDQTLRLARAVRRAGRVRITHLHSRPLPPRDDVDPSDPQAMGRWLGRVLDELKIGRSLVMCVPRRQVLLRPVTLPVNTTAEEIAAMARFQASKDLPIAADEAVIDVAMQRHFDGTHPAGDEAGEQAQAGGLEVLAAAVRQQTIDYHQQLASAAGAKLLALGMRSHAQARCVQACQRLETGQCTCVIHVRPDELLIDVMSDADLVFTRAVRLPGNGAPAAQRSERVAAEAVRNLRSFETAQPRGKVSRVLVAGGSGLETQLAQMLEKQLGRPCQTLDIAGSLELDEPSRPQAANSVAALGLAIGALDHTGLPFDFLHPHMPARKRDHRKLYAGLAAAGVAALLMFSYVVREQMLDERRVQLAEVNEDIAKLEDKRREFRDTERAHEALQAWQDRHQPWLDHLGYLSAILPGSEDLYVTQVATGTTGAVRMGVQARDTQTLNRIDQRLREAGYALRPMAVTPGGDRYGYPFRATVELSPGPEFNGVDLSAHQPPARPADDASLDE